MKHISSRIVAYIFLYCSVIFGIFVLQFTKGKTFSSKIGSLVISGRQEITPTGEKLPLLPIHIIANGLDFYINEQNPLLGITKEGNSKILDVQRYELTKTDFSIHCSENVVFSFSSDIKKDVEVVCIEARIPEHFMQVMLPWQMTQYARIERDKDKVFVRFNKKQYTFLGNFGIEAVQNGVHTSQTDIPHLVLEKSHAQAYYKTYLPSFVFDITTVASMPQASPERYAKAIDAFGTAVMNKGKSLLYEKKASKKMFAAYMAEVGRDGKLNTAFEVFSVQSIPNEMRSYLINPFYNHLEQTYPELARVEVEKKQLYTHLIEEKKVEIFEQENIIPFLVDKKHEHLIEKLTKFADSLDSTKLTVRQAAGILAAYMDFSQYYPNKSNLFEKHIPFCEQKIKNSLLFLEENLYISNDGKIISSTETLAIAHILMNYTVQQTDVWQAVGRMLTTSLLAYTDESAALPAYFKITETKNNEHSLMIADSEILDAGSLYPLVLPNTTWYPHRKSLALQAEPGIWAWTIAQDIEVLEHTTKSLVLRIRFTKDKSHYITLHGIKPFYRIELYGIPFRSDSRYPIYNSSGYRYDSTSKLLYLKMRHKAEYEIIKLFFGQAPVSPASNTALSPSTPKTEVPDTTKEEAATESIDTSSTTQEKSSTAESTVLESSKTESPDTDTQ